MYPSPGSVHCGSCVSLGGRQNRAGRSAFQGPVGHVGLHDSPKSATRSSRPSLQRPPAPLALHGFGEMPQFWRDAATSTKRQTFCGIGRRTTDAPPGRGAASVPFPGTREAFWAVFAPCVPDFGTQGALDFPRSGPRAPHRQDACRLTRARGRTGRRRGVAGDKKS
jgi:hypothetical protein